MQIDLLRRRDFAALIGGAAASWSVAVRAQQPERMRRLGVLMNSAADDLDGNDRLIAFQHALQQLGWTESRNVRIDTRWAANDAEHFRRYGAELVALTPDVILASTSQSVAALQHASRTIPIVFASVIDPVGAGFVASLAHPGGNTTGFTAFEYGMSGKRLELLKEIAPRVARVAVLRNPAVAAGIGQFAAIQSLAPLFGVEVSPIDTRDAAEVERTIATFASEPNGGLIMTSGSHPQLVITLAARHRLPAVYGFRLHTTHGGLISYGPDPIDAYKRAAGYVDRILKGEKPADLPVQAPTKYELVINMKTAKALGLDVPPTLLARADEVIE